MVIGVSVGYFFRKAHAVRGRAMGTLGRRLRVPAVFYSLAIGAFLAVLMPQARAQAQGNGSSFYGRQFAALAHNTIAHQFVMFGGTDGHYGTFDDTWIWRGSTWEKQTPARRPEPRIQAAMAYDSARGEVVLFGGTDQHSRRTASTPWATVQTFPAIMHYVGTVVLYRDMWIWDGKDWTQRSPAQAPSERSCFEMAYDAARKQVVLFGGLSVEGKTLNDTWVWDGSNWRKMNPATTPPARSWQAMAYDPNSGQIVMFGGSDGRTDLGDTWLWDGKNWTQAEPWGDLPEPRFEAGMDYDPSQERAVLVSGWGREADTNDSWTWEGDHWEKMARWEESGRAKVAHWEFEQIYDFSKFDPKDADRALIVNVRASLNIWVPRYVRGRNPEGKNGDGQPPDAPQ